MTIWSERQRTYDPAAQHRDELVGLIFDFQRFSVHDGPGIRTTVFLKGCPLCCQWCQNPESILNQPEITYIASNCVGCGRCLDVCPEAAISAGTGGGRLIDRNRCTLCGKCIDSCYAGALNILGRYLTVKEVMIEVERDRKFYEKSGGGVTFSGGEPTAQPEFLLALCRAAEQRRLHITLDTCCYGHWKLLEPIVQHVDLMLCDIKHMDSAVHRRLTGVPNELILDNIRRISKMGVPIYIRVPLVPGLNDSETNIRATAAFAATLPSVHHFDILPYHRLGEPKWRQLDQSYQLHGLNPPDRPHVFALADVAREYDIRVQVGG